MMGFFFSDRCTPIESNLSTKCKLIYIITYYKNEPAAKLSKVSRSKVVSFFFVDGIFYVVIVFKIYEIIYLRKGQYITGDIL
jgi:hypothetical protein